MNAAVASGPQGHFKKWSGPVILSVAKNLPRRIGKTLRFAQGDNHGESGFLKRPWSGPLRGRRGQGEWLYLAIQAEAAGDFWRRLLT